MLDKNGKEIKEWDMVIVPEPDETDVHIHSFQAQVIYMDDMYVTVADGDGDSFQIEPERLEVVED